MSSDSRKLGTTFRSSSEVKKSIEPLSLEAGVIQHLPFTTSFSISEDSIKKYKFSKKDQQDLQDLQELLREEHNLGPSIRQLRAMRASDGQARALYRLLTLPLKAALRGCTFVPANGGEKEAEFITKVFKTPPNSGGMTITFNRFMSQLLQAMFDGFAAFEKVYWVPNAGPLKGKLTLKKLAYRPAETVTFVVDKDGSFRGLRQVTYAYGKSIDVFIPKSRAFYFAAQEEENPFYGVSFFQSAYMHWDKKVKIYFVAHLAAQRAAVGTRVGTVPRSASNQAKQEFAKNLANMALNQYLLKPEGFEIESVKEGGNFDFLSYLNHHNSQMSKSILAQFLDKDQGAGRGEASVVDNESGGDDMFILMLQSVMDDIAAQINHYIIPDLVDANFKGQKYPQFTWGKFTDDQKKRITKTFDKLASAGEAVNATPEFFREVEKIMANELGLEINYDEIEKREDEEREQMWEQMRQESEQVLESAEITEEITLEDLENETLDGDDEITLSGEEGVFISMAYSFLDEYTEGVK